MPEGGNGFDEFVVARGRVLLRFAYVLTGDAGLAEDLVQEALLRAYRRWDRVAAADRPEAYVRRIVVNEYTSWLRRRRNSEVPATIPDVLQPDGVDELGERDLVWRAMARLPARQRAVLVLRFYEDLPEDEIAQVLGTSGNTVRTLGARALAALRAHPGLARHGTTAPTGKGEPG